MCDTGAGRSSSNYIDDENYDEDDDDDYDYSDDEDGNMVEERGSHTDMTEHPNPRVVSDQNLYGREMNISNVEQTRRQSTGFAS